MRMGVVNWISMSCLAKFAPPKPVHSICARYRGLWTISQAQGLSPWRRPCEALEFSYVQFKEKYIPQIAESYRGSNF